VGAEIYIPILRPRIHYTWTRLSEAPASADIAMAKCDLWEEERRRTITSLRKCFWKSLSDSSELSIKKLDFDEWRERGSEGGRRALYPHSSYFDSKHGASS
jgi:hypothetical protein